jgi:hypothetical protein
MSDHRTKSHKKQNEHGPLDVISNFLGIKSKEEKDFELVKAIEQKLKHFYSKSNTAQFVTDTLEFFKGVRGIEQTLARSDIPEKTRIEHLKHYILVGSRALNTMIKTKQRSGLRFSIPISESRLEEVWDELWSGIESLNRTRRDAALKEIQRLRDTLTEQIIALNRKHQYVK